MKRYVPYLICTFLFVYLIIVLTFASAKMGEVVCKGLQVVVTNAPENSFIDETEIEKIIRNGYREVLNTKLTTVNKDSLEKILVKNPMIESVQVYYSIDGDLHVGIKQREPVLRVMSGGGYYMDKNGKRMPLSSRFTSRVMVATGNIEEEFACKQLAPFAKALKEDAFWDAYIEQLVVLPNKEVVLIPKVGDFRIQ